MKRRRQLVCAIVLLFVVWQVVAETKPESSGRRTYDQPIVLHPEPQLLSAPESASAKTKNREIPSESLVKVEELTPAPYETTIELLKRYYSITSRRPRQRENWLTPALWTDTKKTPVEQVWERSEREGDRTRNKIDLEQVDRAAAETREREDDAARKTQEEQYFSAERLAKDVTPEELEALMVQQALQAERRTATTPISPSAPEPNVVPRPGDVAPPVARSWLSTRPADQPVQSISSLSTLPERKPESGLATPTLSRPQSPPQAPAPAQSGVSSLPGGLTTRPQEGSSFWNQPALQRSERIGAFSSPVAPPSFGAPPASFTPAFPSVEPARPWTPPTPAPSPFRDQQTPSWPGLFDSQRK